MRQALVGEALVLHMMNKEKNCPKCKKYYWIHQLSLDHDCRMRRTVLFNEI